jgi:outer membrane lipoprotein carrier protein
MLKKLIGIVVLTLLGATVVYSLTAEAVFDRLRARYAKCAGLKADFTQSRCDTVSGTCRRSTGRLELAKPDKLRMEVATPRKQLLVADGQALYLYEEGSKQATKQAITGSTQQTPLGDLFFGKEKAFTIEYVLEDSSVSAGGHPLKLTPKGTEAPFKTVTLLVDPKTYACTRVELRTLDEEHHVFDLEKEKLLKKVDPKQFTFTPPAGVAVVEAN